MSQYNRSAIQSHFFHLDVYNGMTHLSGGQRNNYVTYLIDKGFVHIFRQLSLQAFHHNLHSDVGLRQSHQHP